MHIFMNFDTILQQAQEKYKEKSAAKPEGKQKQVIKTSTKKGASHSLDK